jgi:aminopeptidase S
VNPRGADSATAGQWQAATPQASSYQNIPLQLGAASSGLQALVTGYQAGNSVGAYDVDGGLTSVRSPPIPLAANNRYRLQLDYYFAHLWNTTTADFFKISLETEQGRQQVLLLQTGTAANRPAQWQAFSADLSSFAGSTVRLVIEAADGGAGSMLEAAVDNVRINKY